MTEQQSTRQRVTMVLRRTSVVWSLAAGGAIAAICTGMSQVALGHRLPDVVMVYLLGVVVAAIRFGYAASLATAVLGVAAIDFFFTEPYFSFAVSDKRYFVTFAIMLLVAFVISNLMQRVRRSAAAVRERELRTARLYAMSREVAVAQSSADIVRVASRHLRDTFGAEVSVLLLDERGAITSAGDDGASAVAGRSSEGDVDVSTREAVLALCAEDPAGAGNEPPHVRRANGEEIVALRAGRRMLGAVVLPARHGALAASTAERDLHHAMVTQLALGVERAKLTEDAQRAQIEIQRERLRNALLSSVSHDLRTPLGVVKGAVTALLEGGPEVTASRRREYLETISDEASRLNRLVSNLLNMTALEAGALRVRKEWQPLEEVVGVALGRVEEQIRGREVRTTIDPDANLAPFDATLVEQVLINLVENAARYTPAGSSIEISAREVQGAVEISIADRGPGVPAGQEEHVFEKFERAGRPRAAGGMGLGLAICRGIVTVHGGRIWCENRDGGGAAFRFVLPRDAEPPPMAALPEALAET